MTFPGKPSYPRSRSEKVIELELLDTTVPTQISKSALFPRDKYLSDELVSGVEEGFYSQPMPRASNLERSWKNQVRNIRTVPLVVPYVTTV